MRTAIRKLRVHPGRHLTILAVVVVAAAVTTVAVTAGSSHQPEHGAPQRATSGPSASAGIPTQTPAPSHPAGSGVRSPLPDPPGASWATPGASRRTPAGHTVTTSTAAPATTSSRAQQPKGLLQQNEPVPDGVAEQVEFFLGGGRDPDCTTDYAGPPFIKGEKYVETPTAFGLCFYGFKDTQPLVVTFRGPSRPDTTLILQPAENFFWAEFRALPTDPVGLHWVIAEQGTANVSLEFTLQRATSPRLWLDARPLQPPARGADFDLYLGGFPPNQPALLHLYDYHTGRYRTSFTVPVDAIGETHAVIDTKPDDPAGCYGIIAHLAYKPGDLPESVFCIK